MHSLFLLLVMPLNTVAVVFMCRLLSHQLLLCSFDRMLQRVLQSREDIC